MTFYFTDTYTKFKCLEKNYKSLIHEIPNFDISTIILKRDAGVWVNNNLKTDILNNPNNSNPNNSFDRYDTLLKSLETNTNWIKSWDTNNVWYNFPLMIHDKVIGEAENMCPITIQCLKEIGGINVAGFSLLLPNSKLPVHVDNTGPTFQSMAFNMKLTGGECNLHVLQQSSKLQSSEENFVSHSHMTGKAVIFNSENKHYADNKGDVNRVALYIDFKI